MYMIIYKQHEYLVCDRDNDEWWKELNKLVITQFVCSVQNVTFINKIKLDVILSISTCQTLFVEEKNEDKGI